MPIGTRFRGGVLQQRNEGTSYPGGSKGLSKVPRSQPRVGQTIAVHAAPANRTSTYLVSAFLIHSASFVSRTSPICNKSKSHLLEPGAIKGSFFLNQVGQNIALHAAPADRASTCLVSAFPIHSTAFPANSSRHQQWDVS